MSKKQTWQETLNGYLVTKPNGDGEIRGFCPFHPDKSPSAYFNIEKQVMHCKACGAAGDFRKVAEHIRLGHNPFSYDEIYHPDPGDYTYAKQVLQSWDDNPEDELTIDHVMAPFFELTMNDEHADRFLWLLQQRGLKKETIAEYRIGIEEMTGNSERPGQFKTYRYTIPVRGELPLGESYEDEEPPTYVNIRRYSPADNAESKMLNFPGHGRARLFPIQNLHNSDEVVICEGEWDAILTNQNGFTAVTGTAGASTWNSEWNSKFAGKTVYIAYDADDEGRTGSERVAHNLHDHAAAVYIVHIPLNYPSADLTDLWVKEGWSAEQFQELLDSAEPFSPQVYEEPKRKENLPVYAVSDIYENRDGEEFIVEGDLVWRNKSGPPKRLIKSATLSCEKFREACKTCPFETQYGRSREFKINPRSEWVARVVLDGKVNQELEIADELDAYIGYKSKGDGPCKNLNFENMKYTYAQPVTVVNPPGIEAKDHREGMDSADVYVLNDDVDLREGACYRFEGFHVNSEKSDVYVLSTDYEQVKVDIDSFEVDEHFLEDVLPEFQVESGQTVMEKAKDIAARLSLTTHIEGRDDIHLTVLLVMMSALEFQRDGYPIKRGWIDALMYGETRTGKTATARSLLEHSGLGTKASCENVTTAGLVGGVDNSGTSKSAITWGLFPRSDRRMLVMDEMSGLIRGNRNLLSDLTALRSEGDATVQKIKGGRRSARVRTLWMSNPLDGQSSLPRGIDGLKPLVGNDEDIARFDFAIYMSQDDRQPPRPVEGEPIDSDVFRRMVLWAWTRRLHHINLSPQVVADSYAAAEQLMDIIPKHPPLFGTADSYEKIQRIAVAFAIMTGSTRDGENVEVAQAHVQAAYHWLRSLYTRTSMGYSQKKDDDEANIYKCDQNFPFMIPVFMKHEIMLWDLYRRGIGRDELYGAAGARDTVTVQGQTHHGKVIELLYMFGYAEYDGRKYRATEGLKALWPKIEKLWRK